MTCHVFTTAAVAGPCRRCQRSIEVPSSPPHLVGESDNAELVCSECCPIHGPQVSMEWKGEAQTISGEQEGLFG